MGQKKSYRDCSGPVRVAIARGGMSKFNAFLWRSVFYRHMDAELRGVYVVLIIIIIVLFATVMAEFHLR